MDGNANSSLVATAARPGQFAITKAPPWHGSVVADFFLSALAAGLFLFAALGDLTAPNLYGPVARFGFLLAFPLMLADLVSLVVDLGHPARFHHMLRMFKLRSAMSTGVWALSLFAFLSFARFALVFEPSQAVGQIVEAIGIAPALFVGAYKGVLLSTTAQLGWNRARWLGAQLSVSSGALGAAALLLTALLLPAPPAIEGLRTALAVLLILELTFAFVVAAEMRQDIVTPPRPFYRPRPQLGLLAALVLSLFAGEPILLALAASLTLLSALAYRHDLIMLPHRAS